MYPKLTAAVLAGLVACAGATSASADDFEAMRDNGKFTCPGKAAKYDWMLIGTSGDPLYCKLKVNGSNDLSGDCFTSGDPDITAIASGTLKVNSKCEVSGNFALKIKGTTMLKADIEANMTKSQTTIIGALVASSGSGKGQFGTFSAVRIEH